MAGVGPKGVRVATAKRYKEDEGESSHTGRDRQAGGIGGREGLIEERQGRPVQKGRCTSGKCVLKRATRPGAGRKGGKLK